MAVYVAAYWFYASEFLHVDEDQKGMKNGLDDGVKGMRLDNGNTLDWFQEHCLHGSISAYLSAIQEDHVSSTRDDPLAFNANVSHLARKFFEITLPLYPSIKYISPADQLLVGHFVSDVPVLLCKALQDQIRISYVA